LFLFALLSAGCNIGDSDCKAGEGAELTLTTNPATGEAQANGNDVIKIVALGRDENCKPFANGTPIEFRITDQDPANSSDDPAGVGYFSHDGTTIVVNTSSDSGASTNVRGTVVGTAKVSAFSQTHNLTASPVDIEFIEPGRPGQCAIELLAEPALIPADGASVSVITATLTADTGGSVLDKTPVSFKTTRGEFTESGGQNYDTTVDNSTVTATLRSEDIQETVRATVTAAFTCNDTKLYSEQVIVTLGESNAPAVYLRASSNEVPADNVSTVDLTAEVFLPGDARAEAGKKVTFSTKLGWFQESAGPIYVAYTNDSGTASATFIGGDRAGVAPVQASILIQNMAASDKIDISVRQLGCIEFISAVPDKLGAKGSGKNESSLVTFLVKDTEGLPFSSGAPVEFTLSDAPGVTLDSPNDCTDNDGMVAATLNSGRAATTVTVTASAHVGTETLQAVSPPIAVVGAKPNAKYMTFFCKRFNVGGFVLDLVETQCIIGLADRYSNKIGFATNVIFRTEAGSIGASAITSEGASDMGIATVCVQTGDPRPKDVPPLPSEPCIDNHNPRDGIVTILVATTGEEEFDDVNDSGDYDLGEPYVDLSEPYVDENDNGMRDPDEPFCDANDNRLYDGPNGVWDSDTLIWNVAYILWTTEAAALAGPGDCLTQNHYNTLCPETFLIPRGDEMNFYWEIKDANLNPLNSTLQIDFSVDGKGSADVSDPPLPWQAPDTLGGFVNPTRYWEDCGGGFCGWFTVKGAPLTDTTPSETGTITLDITYNQTPGGGVHKTQTITVSGTFE
jgi:hypothetical protein